MKPSILSVMILICAYSSGFTQNQRNKYCLCSTKQTNYYRDSSIDILDTNRLFFIIENINNDTLYLFNSYFQDNIVSSNFLRRIDKKHNILNISFLPLIPFVFTRYSDAYIIYDSNSIFDENQIVYDFYKILPHSKFVIGFLKSDLFPSYSKSTIFLKEFNEKLLINKRQIKTVKKYKINRLYDDKKIRIKFALYKNVSKICNEGAIYEDHKTFIMNAKNYDIVTFEIPN